MQHTEARDRTEAAVHSERIHPARKRPRIPPPQLLQPIERPIAIAKKLDTKALRPSLWVASLAH